MSFAGFTDRELQVLELLARGHPNRVIADELSIAPGTVGAHVAHVFEKLGVHNRTQVAAWYFKLQRGADAVRG